MSLKRQHKTILRQKFIIKIKCESSIKQYQKDKKHLQLCNQKTVVKFHHATLTCMKTINVLTTKLCSSNILKFFVGDLPASTTDGSRGSSGSILQ